MKTAYVLPLLLLSACSTAPKLTLRPQPPPLEDNAGVRYPEVLRAYHVGRYADPNDDLLMHEQHEIYRVEENTRWNLHPPAGSGSASLSNIPLPRDAAFAPTPVNEDILAQVNAQRLATAEVTAQARMLSAAVAGFQTALSQSKTNWQETARLRVEVNQLQKRLEAVAVVQQQSPPDHISATNEPAGSLAP